jgi:tetratricopeptide (TPR) repeat protein
MRCLAQILKRATALGAATFLAVAGAGAAVAAEAELDPLFEALRDADQQGAQAIENRIWQEWSRSGSAAMDLLLDRGRDALEAGEVEAAIEHFSALVDHAPGFAEAYNARATAWFQAGHYGLALEDIRQVRGPWPHQHRQDALRDRADAGAPHRRDRPAAAASGARGL